MRAFLFAGFAALLAVSSPARADVEIAIERGTALTLGRSGIPALPTTGFEDCIEHAGIQDDTFLPGPQGAPSDTVAGMLLKSDFVTSYDELITALNIEAGGKASLTAELLSGSLSQQFELKRDQNRSNSYAAFVVHVVYDFGQRSVRQAKLWPKLLELVNSGKLAEVRQRCGTHFAEREQRGARAAIVISSNSVSKNLALELKQRINAEGGIGGIFKAEANLRIDAALKQLSRYGNVNIEVLANGGNAALLAPVITAAAGNDMKAIIEKLEPFLASFSLQRSVPQRVWLSAIPGLQDPTKSPESQVAFLRAAYPIMLELNGALSALNTEIEALERQGGATAAAVQELKMRRVALVADITDYQQHIRKCIGDAGTCGAGGVPPVPDQFVPHALLERNLAVSCVRDASGVAIVDVTADLRFGDTRTLQALRVTRVTRGTPARITPASLAESVKDPETGRLTLRLDTLRRDEPEFDVRDESSYELQVMAKSGAERWYSLGSPQGFACP
jgi:hypothetical protein